MAAIRSYRGTYHEAWGEAVPQNGGTAQNVQTAIPFGPVEPDDIVDVVLTPVLVVGVPVFTLTYASVAGLLRVTVTNTAAAGNTATFVLDVRYLHSIMQ
jgi:hypothetical protein